MSTTGYEILGFRSNPFNSNTAEREPEIAEYAVHPPYLDRTKQASVDGYRELRKRGVSVREAWNTSESAHGPWRLSQTPALSLALPAKLFRQMGLPELAPARAA